LQPLLTLFMYLYQAPHHVKTEALVHAAWAEHRWKQQSQLWRRPPLTSCARV